MRLYKIGTTARGRFRKSPMKVKYLLVERIYNLKYSFAEYFKSMKFFCCQGFNQGGGVSWGNILMVVIDGEKKAFGRTLDLPFESICTEIVI